MCLNIRNNYVHVDLAIGRHKRKCVRPSSSQGCQADLHAEDCKAKDTKCEAANQAIGKMVVVMLSTDQIGPADFWGLPVGDHWIVTAIGSKGRSYLWNMQVEITKEGTATTLGERNTIIDR